VCGIDLLADSVRSLPSLSLPHLQARMGESREFLLKVSYRFIQSEPKEMVKRKVGQNWRE